jgi:hypothetical protein
MKEYGNYVIIAEDKDGRVNIFEGCVDIDYFNVAQRIFAKNSREIYFSGWDVPITDELAKEMDSIRGRFYSEVEEQVRGLISKLTEKPQTG